ncbi:hypothetical protein KUCAC02_028082, partial [Chaenocephalus aceratus]
ALDSDWLTVPLPHCCSAHSTLRALCVGVWVTYERSQCEVAVDAEVVQISIITLLDISVLIPPLAEL